MLSCRCSLKPSHYHFGCHIWGFLKMVVPQIIYFKRVFPLEIIQLLGYPHFRKPPWILSLSLLLFFYRRSVQKRFRSTKGAANAAVDEELLCEVQDYHTGAFLSPGVFCPRKRRWEALQKEIEHGRTSEDHGNMFHLFHWEWT